MEHISSDFTTTIEIGNLRYEIYGSFTSLPAKLRALENFPFDTIDVHFTVVEQPDGFTNFPRKYHVFIKQEDGTFTTGNFINQRFNPLSGAIILEIQSAVINAYQDAIARKEIEKAKK